MSTRHYSPNTSAGSGLRGNPHDHPTFAPMSRPVGDGQIRPHDVAQDDPAEEAPEAASEAE
jgi:hypothetical protein